MSADILQQLAAATGMQDGPGKKSTGVKDEPARVLLVTTVDVGGGASERIEVRAGENPEDVARAFCQQHHLPDAIIAPLAAHLDENLRKAALSRMQATAQPQDARTPQSGPDATDPAASGMLAPPQHSKSPQRPGQVATAPPCSGGAAPPKQPQYSFGTGMDDRLYEQLSSKLLDESQAPSARRGNWVSASEVLSGAAGPGGGGGSNGGAGSGMNSKRSSGGVSNFGGQQGGYGRLTTSAAPSPRDSVHMRLYATAQERAARQEERRRMANAEQVAAIAASRSSMSWISAEMMRGRGAGGAFDNYGEMLYAEGVESLMNRLKRAQLERKQREDQELEGVTFAPAITKKAWELKQRERTSCSGSMDGMSAEDYEKWQRLHLRGMSKCTQERLEQLRQQREAAEVAECTFRPRINKNSESLMTERAETLKSQKMSYHEQLFADAQRRQNKMEDLQRWYPDGVTFQPQINKDPRSQEYVRRSWDRMSKQVQRHQGQGGQQQGQGLSCGGSVMASTASTGSPHEQQQGRQQQLVAAGGGPAGNGAGAQQPQISVVDRLYAEWERKQAKLEAARQVLHGPIDPVTNKPLFQPEICRGPRGSVAHARSSRGGRHIGEHLYRAAQDLAAKRAAAEEAERRAAEEDASRSRTTAVSQRMFTELKLKRFRQIFEYLDEAGSGFLDLLAALGRAPPCEDPSQPPCRHPRVDNLDGEVLLDVEAAADLWARANGLLLSPEDQRQASGLTGEGSTAEADSPRTYSASTSGLGLSPRPRSQQPGTSAPGYSYVLSEPCPPLNLGMFTSCMEEALRQRRGPRAYLVPSPAPKQAPAHSFRPAINPRSRALAAKSRPDNASTFELLHRVAAKTAERLEALRRQKEEAGMEGCTFQPQLNPNRNIIAGRSTVGRSGGMGSRHGSLNTSSFAVAAAGIAAAGVGGAAGAAAAAAAQAAADAKRRELQQHLAELQLATNTAVSKQAELLQHRAESGGGAEDEEVDGGDEALDAELHQFSLLEQELRDMQALTQVAIDDHDRQQQLLAAAAAQAQAQAQHQQAVHPGSGGVPQGGLQELAMSLGVGPGAAAGASINGRLFSDP